MSIGEEPISFAYQTDPRLGCDSFTKFPPPYSYFKTMDFCQLPTGFLDIFHKSDTKIDSNSGGKSGFLANTERNVGELTFLLQFYIFTGNC